MVKTKRIGQVAGLVAGLTVEDATACEAILDRLKVVAGVNTDPQLASALGLEYSSISSAKTRNKVPTAWIINAANLFKISADWLIFGEQSKNEKALAVTPGAEVSESQRTASIPLVDTELSAGAGSFWDSKTVLKHVEINIELIKFKGPLKDLVFMSVKGDSMVPTIAHQDLVLINLSQTTPYSGGVFAVAHDYGIYIKRLVCEPGRLIMRSDNRNYDDVVVDLHDEAALGLFKIIGRAVWWCHDEKL
jgi:phage repressor protein C with HTH and peptisase S24 domain